MYFIVWLYSPGRMCTHQYLFFSYFCLLVLSAGHVDVQLTASDLIRAGVTVMKPDAGYTNVRRVQISIVGQCGTGKTSFIDALKRWDFNEGQQSTLLFTTEHTCVFRRQMGLESTDKTPADYLARELVSIARSDKLLSAADSHYQPDPGNGLVDVVEKPVTQQPLSSNDRTVSAVQSSSSGSEFNGSVQQSSVQLPAAISAHLSNSIPTSSTDHDSANSEGKSTAPYQQQRQQALQSGREKNYPSCRHLSRSRILCRKSKILLTFPDLSCKKRDQQAGSGILKYPACYDL